MRNFKRLPRIILLTATVLLTISIFNFLIVPVKYETEVENLVPVNQQDLATAVRINFADDEVETLLYQKNNFSKVLRHLYVGNFENSVNRKLLDEHSIKAIVSVIDNPSQHFHDIDYLLINVHDDPDEIRLQDYFLLAAQFIHKNRLKDRPVLVHCAMGISRSATLVTAYLMAITRFGWTSCLNALQAARPIVHPNNGFRTQLLNFDFTLAQLTISNSTLLKYFWNYYLHNEDLITVINLAESIASAE